MLLKAGDRDTMGSKAFDLYRCVLLGAKVPDFVVVPTQYHGMKDEKEAISELKGDLFRVFTELGGDVAVRSSSVAEDLAGSSNAGQFRTVLCVDSHEALEGAILAVWRSSRGRPMAVLVQRMLAPDIAGVLFTRNPVTGKGETVIEHVEGLGEALVSGKRSPVRTEVPDPSAIGPGHMFYELLRVSRMLEQGFGYPLDIEWAISGDELYILQARPITKLPPPDPGAAPSYSRVHAEEFFSGPVTPLFHSLFNRLYVDYYIGESLKALGVRIPRDHPLLVRHKNYLFADTRLTEYTLERMPLESGRRRLLRILPPDIRDGHLRNKRPANPSGIFLLLKFLLMNRRYWRSNLDNHFKERTAPEIIRRLKMIGDPKKMTPSELIEAYDELIDISHLHIEVSKWGLVLYSMTLSDRMGIFLENNGIESDRLPLLMTGLEDNRTLKATEELRSLADIIRQEPRATEVVGSSLPDYTSYKAALNMVPRGDLMVEHFESILTRYGHRRLSRDLISPSWADDPMIPFRILQDLVRQEDGTLSTKRSNEERRMAVQKDIEGRLPIHKRRYFRNMCRYLARYTAFRELQRFYLDMILARMRELICEISTRMHRDDVIENADDVFFLEMEDLMGFLAGKDHRGLKEKALFNRLTYEDQDGSPGLFLRAGVDFNSIDEQEKVKVTGQTIKGQSISPGVHSGKVKVVHDIDGDVRIERGDIIVTRCLDPGQTHFLLMAGALILEVGGMLSHGAILARELGIPTVAQISDATSLLKSGQSVVVNGSDGTICLMT